MPRYPWEAPAPIYTDAGPTGWVEIDERTATRLGSIGLTTVKSGRKYWVRPDWAAFLPEFESIYRLAGPEAAELALHDWVAQTSVG